MYTIITIGKTDTFDHRRSFVNSDVLRGRSSQRATSGQDGETVGGRFHVSCKIALFVYLEEAMKRLCFVLVAVALFASPAFADVTVTMSVSVNAGQMAVTATSVSFFKGTKFRADMKVANQDVSILFDPVTKQSVVLNHATKSVEPFSPQAAMSGMPVGFGESKMSLIPSGQTKQILGRACQGFTLEMTVPITIASETVTMRMTGPVWIAKDGPGVAEYKRVQKSLKEAGLSASPFAQGPQGKAMGEMSNALADAGIPLEQEIRMTMEGTGTLAQMMGQMANATTTGKVTAISLDPIPDEMFAIPQGYTKK
jgi:hypothetical protein